jgi:hypothetical protein
MSEKDRMRRGALKAKEKLCINNLKILHFDSTGHMLVTKNSNGGRFIVSNGDHRSSIRSRNHQCLTATRPSNSLLNHQCLAADRMLWDQCGHDFTLKKLAKQDKLAGNRLSADRVIDIFGEDGTKIPGMLLSDFHLLLDFATNGITPIVAEDFVPERINIPPLRARYVTLKHTINSLLFEQCGKGTMIIMETEQAKAVDGVHFNPQHHADSKGKPESRVIGDLSGQHDPSFSPLNGTPQSKDALRDLIATTWGEIRHPTIVQLVLMIFHAADTHGWKELVLWKKDGRFQPPQLQPSLLPTVRFPSL